MNMKPSFFFLLFFANSLFGQVRNAGNFSITGNVNFKTDRYIYFVWYSANEDRFIDSAKVTNGSFIFRGVCKGYLDRFYIKSDYTNKRVNDTSNSVQVPIDNSDMHIQLKEGEFSKYILSGCKSCNLQKKTDSSFISFYDNISRYASILEDPLLSDAARVRNEKLEALNIVNLKKALVKWLNKNQQSSLAPYFLFSQKRFFNSREVARLYSLQDKFQQESFYGIKLNNTIDFNLRRDNQAGKTAPNFTRISSKGYSVSLKEINKNSYVLLDFWASWCVPCRDSHPDLIKLFTKYHSQNFNIIGIADDDRDSVKWKKAINDDSVFIWPHLLRGHKYALPNNTADLNKLYYVEFLPTKILVDDKGKIIGRYVGGEFEKLESKLKIVYGY